MSAITASNSPSPQRTVLGVIPARLESKRLPRKVLRTILDRPMLRWVYDGARECSRLNELVVATDADEIRDFCRAAGIPVEMTSPRHASGSDRVWEVARRRRAQVIVNIQADEPLICGEHIDELLSPFDEDDSVSVTTLCAPADAAGLDDPNCVKVVRDRRGNALYFSRAAIPFPRKPNGCLQHLGVYAYSCDALAAFHRWKPTPLEMRERLEQLRFLEHGIAIQVLNSPYRTMGVDTEADLRTASELLSNARRQSAWTD